jgi:redox-sensitive bicupin YhaK (pirin superfamily)
VQAKALLLRSNHTGCMFMLKIRRAADRGYSSYAWLKSMHTFSFANYYDPDHMGFRALRVINQDIVQPGTGFPAHSHQDMEIITYVLRGAIAHEDSLGHRSMIHPGEIQRMTAGQGITHSEYNPSSSEELEFLQIWIIPNKEGLKPDYQQMTVPKIPGKLQLLVSPNGEDNSLLIHQDVKLFTGNLAKGEMLAYTIPSHRSLWIQVISGQVELEDEYQLKAGDGAAITHKRSLIRIKALEACEFLLFDLN